jgi:PAS domain S-box-containing protein
MANDVENSANRVKQRPLRMLLVEDNPDDVELCLRLMRKTYPDVHCDVVQRPLEFARRIRTARYDVILSDYALGPWTGLDAFNLMRKAGRDVPFILLTGALGDERAIECITSGITDYVLKDHPERLAVAISRALEQRELFEQHERAERTLRESEAKFQMLAEAIPAATFIEQGTRCCYVNRAAERITGYSREELSGMNFWELLLPDSRHAVAKRATTRFDDGSVSRCEIQIRTKQRQSRWLDVTVGMFQLDGGLAALITAFDISERKRAEYELADLGNHGLSAGPRASTPDMTPLRVSGNLPKGGRQCTEFIIANCQTVLAVSLPAITSASTPKLPGS